MLNDYSKNFSAWQFVFILPFVTLSFKISIESLSLFVNVHMNYQFYKRKIYQKVQLNWSPVCSWKFSSKNEKKLCRRWFRNGSKFIPWDLPFPEPRQLVFISKKVGSNYCFFKIIFYTQELNPNFEAETKRRWNLFFSIRMYL